MNELASALRYAQKKAVAERAAIDVLSTPRPAP
jgi:hypothetical protein